jgi:hypothetical protein
MLVLVRILTREVLPVRGRPIIPVFMSLWVYLRSLLEGEASGRTGSAGGV